MLINYMFRTLQYYYWNIGYILSDVYHEIKNTYFYRAYSYNYGYYNYQWHDDSLLNEIYKLEERIAELEDLKDQKSDIVLVVNNNQNLTLEKFKRSKSI